MKPNIVYSFSIERILNDFTPGDYCPAQCWEDCWEMLGYHDCGKLSYRQRWDNVLFLARGDEQYAPIKKEIARNGFLVPLAAKISTGHLVLCDGHHRIAAAIELDIVDVDVYVAAQEVDIGDLVAMDSHTWYGSGVESPFIELVGD